MIVILWRYVVDPLRAEAFEAAYGPDGDWTRLFARTPGYLGTELLHSGPGDYITVDRWTDAAAHDAFHEAHGAAYATLDRLFEPLTEDETRIGLFEVLG